LNSSRISALEQKLRDYLNRGYGEVIVPAVEVTFDSAGEAYEFYNIYFLVRGFGVTMEKAG
jgi:hypothetical protein